MDIFYHIYRAYFFNQNMINYKLKKNEPTIKPQINLLNPLNEKPKVYLINNPIRYLKNQLLLNSIKSRTPTTFLPPNDFIEYAKLSKNVNSDFLNGRNC